MIEANTIKVFSFGDIEEEHKNDVYPRFKDDEDAPIAPALAAFRKWVEQKHHIAPDTKDHPVASGVFDFQSEEGDTERLVQTAMSFLKDRGYWDSMTNQYFFKMTPMVDNSPAQLTLTVTATFTIEVETEDLGIEKWRSLLLAGRKGAEEFVRAALPSKVLDLNEIEEVEAVEVEVTDAEGTALVPDVYL